MDREEAKSALEILRKVVETARDDSALQNWGAIWMFSAFTNSTGFGITHVWIRGGQMSPWPYAGLWGAILSVNLLAIFVLKAGSTGGARSFIENQIWSIWTTFIVAMLLAALVNWLMGLDRLFMPAVACIIAAIAFSMMGAIMGAWWYLPAALWAAMALVMASLPQLQFAIFAGLWFCTQFTGGALLHLARRRRLASGPQPRLV